MNRRALYVLAVVAACARGTPVAHQVSLAWPAQAPTGRALGRTLEIVTFNVHRRPGDSIARAVAHDPVLREADVIALQEVPAEGPCDAACVAARELGWYSAYVPDFRIGGTTIGQAILSRVPLVSARAIVLPDFHVHGNAALVATFRIADQPITIYAIHLTDEISFDERVAQLTPILEDTRSCPTPMILAGDFNTPLHYVGHSLPIPRGGSTAELEARVRSYGFATPVAGSGATFRVVPLKLDAIYTRGFETMDFGTARARDISDHLALWAVVTARPDVASLTDRAAHRATTASAPRSRPECTGGDAACPPAPR
jgi:endonuclease/exonuclease/phosphatase family metal-dependent hydrolase